MKPTKHSSPPRGFPAVRWDHVGSTWFYQSSILHAGTQKRTNQVQLISKGSDSCGKPNKNPLFWVGLGCFMAWFRSLRWVFHTQQPSIENILGCGLVGYWIQTLDCIMTVLKWCEKQGARWHRALIQGTWISWFDYQKKNKSTKSTMIPSGNSTQRTGNTPLFIGKSSFL